MDLFASAKPAYEPLASRMRPRRLEQFVGQDHILAPGRLLRRAIEADHLTSVLFYGPPGTGKTTLARLIAATTKGAFLSLNAVLSGVKEIREIIDQAQEERELRGRKTILFVDEVHRWNKAQQDALLPWVENGTFLLVGATTENPFFEVNSALVSRSRVFQLLPLNENELFKIADQASKDPVYGYGRYHLEWEPGALEHLVEVASGDARSLLNALELAVETAVTPFPPEAGSVISISRAAAEESIQKRIVLYDKDGDYHFDTISAFIKSLRGSDPDAALYWLAKMIRAGEDPRFIFRRMLISASEDVGLADPQALVVVQAASAAFDKIGLPEGQYALAQAAVYLATCPKSASLAGYFEALKTVELEKPADVPSVLKDASRDGKALGHGQGYLYPHAFRDHWVAQRYLPAGFEGRVFYEPTSEGYEASIRPLVLQHRHLLLALETDSSEENLTYSPKGMSSWAKRLALPSARTVESAVKKVVAELPVRRHDRVWIAKDFAGLVTREVLPVVPEGGVWTSVEKDEVESAVFDGLPEVSRPEIYRQNAYLSDPRWEALGLQFDLIVAWTSAKEAFNAAAFLASCKPLLAPKSTLTVVEPVSVQRLTEYLPQGLLEVQELEELLRAETAFFESLGQDEEGSLHVFHERRSLTAQDWGTWWDAERTGGLGAFLSCHGISKDVLSRIAQTPMGSEVNWKRAWRQRSYPTDIFS
jgi:putative ATPase